MAALAVRKNEVPISRVRCGGSPLEEFAGYALGQRDIALAALGLCPRSEFRLVNRLRNVQRMSSIRELFETAPAEGAQLPRAYRSSRANLYDQLVTGSDRSVDDRSILRPS